MQQQDNRRILKSKKTAAILLGMLALVGVGGAAAGTYAWYTYNKTAGADLTGTSIRNSDRIQIGLRASSKLDNLVYAQMDNKSFYDYYVNSGEATYEQIGDDHVFWIKNGEDIKDILRNYSIVTRTAFSALSATTSGYFKSANPSEGIDPMDWDIGNRDLVDYDNTWNGFKRVPGSLHTDFSQFAISADYIHLPLAFRVFNEADDSAPIPNQDVYMSNFKTKDLSKNQDDQPDLSKALRCKVDYPQTPDHSKDFIFDPNSDEDYELPVAGALNISSKNSYYDYKEHDDGELYEVAYGEFNGDPVYEEDVYDSSTETQISNDQITTFKANHFNGVHVLKNEHIRTCETKSNVFVDPLLRGDSIITTDDDGVGYVDLSIYLEGWDQNVVDSAATHQFSIDLEFEID